MFSNESARHADACRFCWMCRHICPVAGATGNEGWGPRARGLMVSMIERGTEYEESIADAMYHCTLCDACANDCATSYKPSEFIREARTLAVANGLAKKVVQDCIDQIVACGNIFGEDKIEEILSSVGALPEKAEVALYLGQTARTVYTKGAIAACSLMKKAGVNFMVLKQEPASGAYLSELMGYTGDVQQVAKATATKIEETGAHKLAVLNPADAVIFKDQYSQWGLLKGIEVVTFTTFVAQLIESGSLTPKGDKVVGSLQEPNKLTRGLDEIEPLKQIASAAKIDLIEMYLNGKMTRCIGTIPSDFYDSVATSKMVKVRCDDAARLDCSMIITAAPDDFYIMEKYANEDMTIVDIFDILNRSC